MINNLYRTAQLLSLDIVIGVVILLRFFCAQSGVAPSWQVYALLSISVWIIYTIDHLRDAQKAKDGSRVRYAFHLEHKRILLIGVGSACLVAVPLLFYIPQPILWGGLALGAVSLLYLLIQQQLSTFLFKEFYVASVYSIGILMVPYLLGGSISVFIAVSFFLLANSNLILFSWFEIDQDRKDGFSSLATSLNYQGTLKYLVVLISTGLVLSLTVAGVVGYYLAGCFMIYALVLIKESFFKINSRYRGLCDAVFCFPIFLVWG